MASQHLKAVIEGVSRGIGSRSLKLLVAPRRIAAVGPVLCGLLFLLFAGAPPTPASAQASGDQKPVPVLAYYYIWFDPGSWDRAKIDYPLLGHYSSDDRVVMLKQVRMAKQAGIDGFIVSWKSTDVLNRRLEQLIQIADAEDFKLAIIYQGLDFERDPQPADRIATDLDYFIEHYAGDKAFDMFARPMVIWSGTWEYSPEAVAQVASPRRNRLLILASERSEDAYQRLAGTVDGDAYYWSSVDPQTFPGYQEKLNAMGKAAHARGGYWIAPAAPGFDARLIGGARTVDRKDGATLHQEMAAAARSGPDAIGLISWNEFTENSYIEPSVTYGARYVDVLSSILKGQSMTDILPPEGDFDPSEAASTEVRPNTLIILGSLGGVVLLSFGVIVRRSLRRKHLRTGPGQT